MVSDIAEYDLGTARGKIELDASGAEDGAKRAQGAVNGLGRSATDSSGGMLVLGGALTAVGVAAVGGFGIAVNAASNFEKGLSNIKAVSGATEAQMETVRKKALQLGADTAFSAGEASAAMEELVKAGLSVDDVLNGAADATVALAAAGEIALPEAAAIASAAMNQFNLAASDLPNVADKIAGAANASAISVSDFGQSMNQAGAVANLVGITFDDMALAITAMGNAGIKGSDAGTSLKTMLMNLQPATTRQKEAMMDLGLWTKETGSAFFDAEGKVKSMGEISDLLRGSLSGLTDAQKTMALETMFGSDAIRAAAIITEQGSEGFENLAVSMGKVTAADVAATKMDNFAGSMEQLKGSLDTFLITIGTPFLGALRNVVDMLTEVINWIGALDPQVLKMISYVVLAAGALAGMAGALIFVVSGVQKLRAALAAINIVGFLTNPIGLVILAIAAVAAAFILLYKHSETFRNIVAGVMNDVKKAIDLVVGALRAGFTGEGLSEENPIIQFFQSVGEGARIAFDFVQNFARQIGNLIDVLKSGDDVANGLAEVIDSMFGDSGGLIEPVRNLVLFVQGTLFPVIQQVVERFGGWGRVIAVVAGAIAAIMFPIPALIAALVFLYAKFEAVRNVVATVIDVFMAIGQVVMTVISAVVPFVVQHIGSMVAFIVEIMPQVLEAVTHIWNAIRTVIETVMNIVVPIVKAALTVIKTLWDAVGDDLINIIGAAWKFIQGLIGAAMTMIQNVIRLVLAIINGDWGKAWDAIKGILIGALQQIDAVIRFAFEVIRNIFTAFLSILQAAWRNSWNMIQDVLRGAWEAIKWVFTDGIATVVRFIAEMPGKIIGFLSGLSAKMRELFMAALHMAADGTRAGAEAVFSFLRGLPGQILGAIGDLGRLLYDQGRKIIDGLLNGIQSAIGKVKETLQGVTNMIPDWKGPPKKDEKLLVQNGTLIMTGLAEGLAAGMNDVKRVLNDVAPFMVASPQMNPPAPGAVSAAPLMPAAVAPSIHIGTVEIAAKDLEEMRTVQDFFDRIQQVARQGVV